MSATHPGGATSPAPAGGGGHGLVGTTDAGAFLARLVRLAPDAVVRLRSDASAGRTAIWARLPWNVLVVRTVTGPGPGDATVSAGELLAVLDGDGATLPGRRDAQWRWPLPPPASRPVETVPVAEVRRIAAAAAGALRSAAEHGVAGRAVGQRAVRDALLDHVPVLVSPDDSTAERVEVNQRLIQAVVRMGFLGRADADAPTDVGVRVAGRWVALVGPFGAAWSQKVADLVVNPIRTRPFG
ncbi:hypothetical protein ACN28G_19555 [Micromonospora sp. WMMA1923]|uniref:hypothetical protein n=1 Tax=Micromonospora sp. WMMA1923 TaxID=3404125 RepID=UPI003B9631D6